MKKAIVLGYGLFKDSNQEYKDYLEWIAAEVKDKGFEKIILCGGASSNLEPDLTEGESMRQYLAKISPDLNLVLEEKSLTTPQNLEFASGEINSGDEIVVFGDLIRSAKIIWLSLHYLLKLDRQEISRVIFEFAKDRKIRPFVHKNLTVLCFDFPSRDKNQATMQSFSSLLEVEALYDQELEQMILDQRKIDFGLQGATL